MRGEIPSSTGSLAPGPRNGSRANGAMVKTHYLIGPLYQRERLSGMARLDSFHSLDATSGAAVPVHPRIRG